MRRHARVRATDTPVREIERLLGRDVPLRAPPWQQLRGRVRAEFVAPCLLWHSRQIVVVADGDGRLWSCSVWQCVGCSVLRCVAVGFRGLHRVAVRCSVYSVLQCVAVRCSALQCVSVVCCSVRVAAVCCSNCDGRLGLSCHIHKRVM